MSEGRDPAIKLFGRTIPPLEPPEEAEEVEEGEAAVELGVDAAAAPVAEPAEVQKDSCKEVTNMEVNNSSAGASDDANEDVPASSSGLNSNENDHKVPTEDEKVVSDSKTDHKEPDAEDSSQEKVLKKPDKILPCPRCKSMDTKFCYYNNYNINQPRHFCKNCQRYWTAGGTMRNVPVGAGRRKSKHSSSQYRQIMVSSDGFQPAQLENSTSAHCQALPCRPSAPTKSSDENGTILKFGTEMPLCESMASALSINENDNKCDFSSKSYGENKEEPLCASSVTASNCFSNGLAGNSITVEQNGLQGYYNGMRPMHEFQCYPLATWAYPWNPGWTNVAPMTTGRCLTEFVHTPDGGSPTAVPWSHPTMVATPAFCPPLPFPYMPPSWGCISNWPTGPLSVPWYGFNNDICQSSSTSYSGCSENGSPTLGKHSRDVCLQSDEKMEKSLWVPKTLRIDDPNEAAKSSIWATLGIKPEVGIFKPFLSKAENKAQTSGAAQVLQANPAALSRSESFQENT